MKKERHLFARTYLGLILLFLYAPILVLIVFSFNASKSRASWDGFTLDWYLTLFRDPEILHSLYITLAVALLAAAISVVLGTMGALGMHGMSKRGRTMMTSLSRIPMLTPDIVTGTSLMILFVFSKLELNFFTMLLAHISFDVPYVVFAVMPKLQQMNTHAYEAALDLGATPRQALWRIVLPEIRPGIITGFILAFTISLDDFVVSFFTSGTQQTLSVLVYSMARRGISPTINALSTLLFVTVLVLLWLVNRRTDLKTMD